jgi:tight adherence protein C
MAVGMIVFFVMFLILLAGGGVLFYRETMSRRISDVISSAPRQRTMRATLKETGFSLVGIVKRFENLLPKSKAEISVTVQRLRRAGFRSDSAVNVFYGSKVLVPILLLVVALVTGLVDKSPFVAIVGSLGIGFLIPDFWLGRQITSRQSRIRRGLPDILDLMVICIEAGLSMDQATLRTEEEMVKAYPDLCDELHVLTLEQRAGRARAEAWKNLADRTDVDNLRNLAAMMVQSDQFGTSVAKTLRVHADTLRTQRVQAIEEQASKTSVKLVFPLVLFIFPALFLVIMGPAIILMMESFSTLNH